MTSSEQNINRIIHDALPKSKGQTFKKMISNAARSAVNLIANEGGLTPLGLFGKAVQTFTVSLDTNHDNANLVKVLKSQVIQISEFLDEILPHVQLSDNVALLKSYDDVRSIIFKICECLGTHMKTDDVSNFLESTSDSESLKKLNKELNDSLNNFHLALYAEGQSEARLCFSRVLSEIENLLRVSTDDSRTIIGLLKSLHAKVDLHISVVVPTTPPLPLAQVITATPPEPSTEDSDADDVAMMTKRAMEGDAEAQHELGKWHQHGEKGLRRNPQEAFKWYLMSAEQNNRDGLYRAGCALATGEISGTAVVAKNTEIAILYLTKSKAQDNVHAIKKLDIVKKEMMLAVRGL